jgi:hypothetical protein
METWKEVPGYEQYLVSDSGRVAKISQMKLPTEAQPYYVHNIPDGNGGRVNCYRHDWVLAAFVGPKPEGAVVRHLNDVPTDNRLENLAYGTRSENQFDWRNARYTPLTVCKRGHVLAEVGTYEGNRCRKCRIDRARRQREVK